MTDNPLSDSEVTYADIGDAEADAERRRNNLLRAVLMGLFIFSISRLKWQTAPGLDLDERQLLDALSQEEQERALDVYAAFNSGAIDAARWLADMATNLRRFHLQSAAIGRGGFDALTQTDLDRVSNWLETEFSYLRGFDPAALSDAQVAARLQMYHNHAQSVFWDARRTTAGELNYTQERRQLNPAEHCGDCEGYAAQNWQPIGTLPPPGESSECLSNCKCTMEFR